MNLKPGDLVKKWAQISAKDAQLGLVIVVQDYITTVLWADGTETAGANHHLTTKNLHKCGKEYKKRYEKQNETR